jgi:SAM-dependent methyltransferase
LPAGLRSVPNRLCPRCGSLQRYRALKLYLEPLIAESAQQRRIVCEVAPKPCFRNWIRAVPHLHYVGVDLASKEADVLTDVTQLALADRCVDIVVCLHVLEHVRNDRAAIAELCRAIRPGGFGLFMVPMRGPTTVEDPNVPPEHRERVFGQADHVRFYGADFVERFRLDGYRAEMLDILTLFPQPTIQKNALLGDDRFFVRVSRTLPTRND